LAPESLSVIWNAAALPAKVTDAAAKAPPATRATKERLLSFRVGFIATPLLESLRCGMLRLRAHLVNAGPRGSARLPASFFRGHREIGGLHMRPATFVLCLINAGLLLMSWMGRGGSDIAGNALEEALLVLWALIFAVTALPAFALAVAGRLPRIAFWLAFAGSLLSLLVYSF
jgi:hypothetical protein